jgi:trimethylamine--corrinoid protein Co-methyltransferase
MIVLGDEMISMVRRLLRGIEITPETLALDAIHEVGPGGDYLTASHTMDHYRSVWYPRLLDRRPFESWEKSGKPTTNERARELVRRTLATHKPEPIPASTLEQLDAIVAKADAEAGQS